MSFTKVIGGALAFGACFTGTTYWMMYQKKTYYESETEEEDTEIPDVLHSESKRMHIFNI